MSTDQSPVERSFGLLLAAVANRFPDPGTRVVGQPGQTTTDDWCAGGCGMVYVRLDTMFPSSLSFPQPDPAGSPCDAPLAVTWVVGTARCVAGLDAKGGPPDAGAQTDDAGQIMADAMQLRCAIQDAVREDRHAFPAKSTLLGRWTPVGPLGDCAGGFWTLTHRPGR